MKSNTVTAIAPKSLNAANAALVKSLRSALEAVEELDTVGATVIDVHLGGRNPRLEIEPGKADIAGAIKTRERRHGVLRVVMTARVGQCQVEWAERYRDSSAA